MDDPDTKHDTNRFTIKGVTNDANGGRYYTSIGVMWRNKTQDGHEYFRLKLKFVPLDISATDILAFPATSRDGGAEG